MHLCSKLKNAFLATAALLALGLLPGCSEGDPTSECSTDADCSGSERCVSGDCQDLSATPCTLDGDCPAGETCQQGFCAAGSGLCSSDLDCNAGETCDLFTGSCVRTGGCLSDSDCAPPGTVCEAGSCVGGCPTAGCGGTDVCNTTTGRCEPDAGCSLDSECGVPALVCEAGLCVAGCGSTGGGGGCPNEAYCDATTGRCVAGCRDDGDCSAPSRVCVSSSCTDGCATAGCGGGEVCNTTTGRCEVDTTCAVDSDCAPPASVCEAPACVAGCTVTGACGAESYCDGATGRCVAGCLADADCAPPARVCDTASSSCTDGCSTTGCNVGNTCNTLTGHCEPGCASDGDCNVPTDVCEGNSCVPGCGMAGCTTGNLCDTGTGRCYPGCNVDADCNAPAEICDPTAGPDGSCVPGCDPATGGAGCPVGNYCDTTTGYCAAGCLADSDCDLPAEVCDTSSSPGSCTPGCSLTGCSGADLCAGATSGRCEPPGSVALGFPCTEHAECQSDVCLVLPTGGLCTQPCSASGQCPNDFWCLDALTAPGSFLCWHESQFSTDFGNDLAGAFCNNGINNCKSGWCNTVLNQCTDTCQNDADCSVTGPGATCTHLVYNSGSLSDLVCSAAYAGGGTGTLCNPVADPDASGCARGACLDYGATSLCADPCCTSNDCPSGYACANVGARGGTIFRMCVQEPTATGTGTVGTACDPATGSPCRSGVCLTDALGSFCSDTCCTQTDCAVGMRCEEVPLPDAANPTEIIPLCLRR